MFGLPGGSEWILLVLIVLLLFGSARLPRLARSMREAKDEFKKANDTPKADAPVEPAEKAAPSDDSSS
jgi:sec-independent protein translocase protein TatA